MFHFFASIPPEKFHELASYCDLVEFQSGQSVFSQGEPGKCFYLIAWGDLDVMFENKESNDKNQEKIKIRTLTTGQYFGESALVNDSPRPATIVARTRCVLLTLTKENFESFFQDSPVAYAEFCLKLSRNEAPLTAVLAHPNGFIYFEKFVQSEYSAENLAFWVAAKHFGNLNPAEMKEAAKNIFNKYIDEKAPQQVNIPSEIREHIRKNLDTEVTREFFSVALAEIIKLMSKDSYHRFKQTSNFAKLLEEVGSYSVLLPLKKLSMIDVNELRINL